MCSDEACKPLILPPVVVVVENSELPTRLLETVEMVTTAQDKDGLCSCAVVAVEPFRF